jgi:integrase
LQNYRRHIEEHLLPTFEHVPVGEIEALDIAKWEKAERAVPYAPSSVKTWRSTLHLILADAVDQGLRDSNPAAKRRGRGRRDGRSRSRGPEKVVTDALGILLLAERAALLSGRDDEFVAVVLKGFTGMRWGEVVGLETEFVRPASVRVEWQLYELDTGEFHRCGPKDDSRRTIDLTDWLAELLADHIATKQPEPCACHARKYVFNDHRPANRAARRPGAKLVDVARLAGVSTGTVSTVLNRPESVPEKTRTIVQKAVADLGYVRGGQTGELAAHWRRNGFATWLFRPAATGWYPRKAPYDPHPVPILAEQGQGVLVRGRNASERGNACWLPIATGLTPHGLRHSHKTMMEELGIPPKLMDERMGHEDGSVQSRYSHVTSEMRRRLLAGLTERWEAALEQRRQMSPGSPVAVLDRMLRV